MSEKGRWSSRIAGSIGLILVIKAKVNLYMSVSGWFKYKQSGHSGEINSLLEKMSFWFV